MKRVISFGFVFVLILQLVACGSKRGNLAQNISDEQPNISVEQMMLDLAENDIYITTAWWEDIYHLRFADFEFYSFEITKTLTEEKIAYYYVDISGKNNYNSEINAPFIITYKKFNEGWSFTSIKYKGSI